MTPGILMILNLLNQGVGQSYSNIDGGDTGKLRLEHEGKVIFEGQVLSNDYDVASKLKDLATLPLSEIAPVWRKNFLENHYSVEMWKNVFFMDIEETLKELNYEITKNDGQYIEAFSTHVWSEELNCAISVKEKRKLNINYDTDHIYFGIREDWDTRYVYNGTIKTLGDIAYIDNLTRLLPTKRVES